MFNRLLPCLLMLSLLSVLIITHASELLEYKLATINAGGYVSKDDINVGRFRGLLNRLSATFVENEQQIADMSVAAQSRLKEEGVQESLLNIMEGMNQLFSKRIENQKYAEYAATYVTLRIKGQGHAEAIRGLQAILRSFGVQ